MRPRVFPAEDPPVDRIASAARPPSMRPRVFPAEDRRDAGGGLRLAGPFNEAAGIPRGRLPVRRIRASRTHFNEAAGIPRGRHTVVDPVGHVHHTSMRPRVFPAEDVRRQRVG